MIHTAAKEPGVENVIIQFGSFVERDRWLETRQSGINRVYKRDPWVAASISSEVRAGLAGKPDVKIVQDSQLSPMSRD